MPNQWIPISQAPKDQTEVLVYAPTEEPSVFTAKYIYGWSRSVSGNYAPLDDFFGDDAIEATHFMFLPEPPNIEG